MINISIGSLNVWGLGNNDKRRQVFTWLREKKLNIYLLQEIKCTSDKEKIWATEWGYKTIFNVNDRAAQGVCILFNNNFEFEIKDIRKDLTGRYIIVHLTINKEHVILVNIYGPNNDNCIFYDNLFSDLEDFVEHPLVIGGDFNLCLSELDKQGGRSYFFSHRQSRKVLIEYMDKFEIVDIWRNLNPTLKEYTWRQRAIEVSCRLDFFLTSFSIANLVQKVEILSGFSYRSLFY